MSIVTMYRYNGTVDGDPVLLDDKELIDEFFTTRYAEGVNFTWSRNKLSSFIVSKWLSYPDRATEDHLIKLLRERLDTNMALKAVVLNAAEVDKLTARNVNIDLTEYKEVLNSFDNGQWVKIEGDEDSEDTPRAIRRRFTLASKELGFTLKYRKDAENENAVIFQVIKSVEEKKSKKA